MDTQNMTISALTAFMERTKAECVLAEADAILEVAAVDNFPRLDDIKKALITLGWVAPRYTVEYSFNPDQP